MKDICRRIIVIFLLFSVINSCTSSPKADKLDEAMNKQEITDTILNKMNQYANALNRQDAAAWLNCYVSGDEFRLYSDGKILSYQEMKIIAEGFKKGFRSVQVSWDTIVVTLASNSVALATAPFHRKLEDTAGNIINDKGVANWLFVNRNGQWKMLYGHGDHQPENSEFQKK